VIISLVVFSPGSAETNVRWGGKLNGHLMASCIRNIRTKNYQNLVIGFEVTVENVGDIFSGTHCLCGLLGLLLSRFPSCPFWVSFYYIRVFLISTYTSNNWLMLKIWYAGSLAGKAKITKTTYLGIQDHTRSLILVSLKRTYSTFYKLLIVALVLFRTVFEILLIQKSKSSIFATFFYLAPSVEMTLFEFSKMVYGFRN